MGIPILFDVFCPMNLCMPTQRWQTNLMGFLIHLIFALHTSEDTVAKLQTLSPGWFLSMNSSHAHGSAFHRSGGALPCHRWLGPSCLCPPAFMFGHRQPSAAFLVWPHVQRLKGSLRRGCPVVGQG